MVVRLMFPHAAQWFHYLPLLVLGAMALAILVLSVLESRARRKAVAMASRIGKGDE